MADINITVDSPVIRKENEPEVQATVEMNARRTLDNNIMILDHEEIDIVVYPEDQKILALAKNDFSDNIYETQDRFFKFLYKKGVIDYSSVHSGNVYGSLEASILESKVEGVDSTQVSMFSIQKFLEMEKPYFMISKAYQRAEEARVTDPDDEESTDSGEVPHGETKGSLGTANAYGLGQVSVKNYKQYA